MTGGLEAIRRATNHCLAIQADEHKEEVTLHRIIIIIVIAAAVVVIIIITLTVDCSLSVGVSGCVECIIAVVVVIIIIITLTVDCPLSVGVPGYVECSHGGCSRQRPCDQG